MVYEKLLNQVNKNITMGQEEVMNQLNRMFYHTLIRGFDCLHFLGNPLHLVGDHSHHKSELENESLEEKNNNSKFLYNMQKKILQYNFDGIIKIHNWLSEIDLVFKGNTYKMKMTNCGYKGNMKEEDGVKTPKPYQSHLIIKEKPTFPYRHCSQPLVKRTHVQFSFIYGYRSTSP